MDNRLRHERHLLGSCASGVAALKAALLRYGEDGRCSSPLAAGAMLTHSGELDVQHGATLSVYADATSGSGTLAIAPGSGALCKLSFANPGTGVPVLETWWVRPARTATTSTQS